MNLPWPRRTEPEFDPRPVPVDFDGLEKHLRAGQEVADYAPKRQQAEDIDRAVNVITSFSALPTKEIDDTILQLEEELTEIKADAQRVRNAYVEVTDRLMKYIERQKAVNKIARTAFAAMRDQCTALDQPELPLEPPARPAVPTEEPAA